jgi:hypothetical protein
MSRWLVSFVSLMMLCVAGAAQAADQPVRLTYQVYAGGFHVVQTDFDLVLKQSTYNAVLGVYTRGFLGSLVPWKGSFATTGVRTKDHFQVRQHVSSAIWKGSEDATTYDYDAKGQFKKLKKIEGGVDKTPKDLDPALTKDTTDILTGTLNMMAKAKNGKGCDGSAEIFDGRRRFTLIYKPLGWETLKKSKYGLYEGAAMKCTAEVKPNGGAWHKKPRGWLSIQEQGRKKGALPTLWLAEVDPKLPPVPVRIMLKTDYGTLFIHLSNLSRAP